MAFCVGVHALRKSIILELLITILIGTCSACGKIHVLDGPGKADAGSGYKRGIKNIASKDFGCL